jgi:hypothetical protein
MSVEPDGQKISGEVRLLFTSEREKKKEKKKKISLLAMAHSEFAVHLRLSTLMVSTMVSMASALEVARTLVIEEEKRKKKKKEKMLWTHSEFAIYMAKLGKKRKK